MLQVVSIIQLRSNDFSINPLAGLTMPAAARAAKAKAFILTVKYGKYFDA